MKKISKVFVVMAIILSHMMCAVVAYNYCDMQWKIKYSGYSAPSYLAFLYAIPYGIGIVVCIIIATILREKELCGMK